MDSPARIEPDLRTLCDALRPLRGALDHRRIFLTGGTGFFGKWLLHSFLGLRNTFGLDTTLTVLSRDPKRFLSEHPGFADQDGLSFVEGDVRTFAFRRTAPFDDVIHGATAASAKLERENPEEMYSVITEGTRRMLDFTRACGARRFLFISSGAVYGPQPPLLRQVPETYEGEPIAAYGKGKKASEQLCLAASAGRFECVIARPFAFVGPYLPLDTHFAIGNFISDVLTGNRILIKGDGRPYRSYQYAADLAIWLWTLLLKGNHARAYNVGSEEAISIRDLSDKVRACAGTDTEIVVEGTPDPVMPPPRYVPSVKRAQEELGLTCRYTLDMAIRRTLDWCRAG